MVASGLLGVIVTGTPSREPDSWVAYSTTWPVNCMDVPLVTDETPPWVTVSVGAPSRVSEFTVNSIMGTVVPLAVGICATPL